MTYFLERIPKPAFFTIRGHCGCFIPDFSELFEVEKRPVPLERQKGLAVSLGKGRTHRKKQKKLRR